MSELPIKVKVQDSASQVVYTDAVLINGNPLGFVLNFGQWAPAGRDSTWFTNWRVLAGIPPSTPMMRLNW